MKLFFLGILLSCSALAGEFHLKDFAYGSKIERGEPGQSVIELQVNEYTATKLVHPKLYDLRIFNESSEEVPHEIHFDKKLTHIERRPNASVPFFPLYQEIQSTRNLADKIRVQDNGTIIEITRPQDEEKEEMKLSYLIDLSVFKDFPDKLIFNLTGKEIYMFKIQVKSSNDLNYWNPRLYDATFARLERDGSQIVKKELSLNQFGRRKYLLIPWIEKDIAIESIEAAFEPSKVSEYDFTDTQSRALGGVSNDKNKNEYVFDLGFAALVREIQPLTSAVNSMGKFKIEYSLDGKAWSYFNSSQVYNLSQDNIILTNEAIETGRNLMARYWKLTLLSDPTGFGSQAPSLDLRFHLVKLRFLARGKGPFLLAYGSSKVDHPLKSFKLPVELGGVETAALGKEVELGGEAMLRWKPQDKDASRRYWLWIVLSLGVIFMAYMAKTLIAETKSPQ